MQGLHLTADLLGCRPAQPAAMTEPAALRGLCLQAVRQAGLRPVGELFHGFAAEAAHGVGAAGAGGATGTGTATAQPAGGITGGITGVVLLAESHLAVHTWPEMAAVTLDVYVCNLAADNSARAAAVMAALEAAFAPAHSERQRLLRGTGSAAGA